MFFPKDKNRDPDSDKPPGHPIKVDGALTVYAFDETYGGKGSAGAPRKFVFSAKKLSKLYRESSSGPSYVVWLPWDSVGGPTREVRLLARFDDAAGGPVVMSETSHHRLPGTSDQSQIAGSPAESKGSESDSQRGNVTQTGLETGTTTDKPGSIE